MHKKTVTILLLCLLAGLSGPVLAQTSATEILEKARSQAKDFEDLKKALNGPDQNMRLATFDAMVRSGDPMLRDIAIDIGMASADSLMQAAAFREAIMGLDRLHFSLEIDPNAPEKVQETSTKALNKGSEFVLQLGYHDRENARFAFGKGYKDNPKYMGEVTGTTLTFQYGNDSGTFTLKDDNMIEGILKSAKAQFVATSRIR